VCSHVKCDIASTSTSNIINISSDSENPEKKFNYFQATDGDPNDQVSHHEEGWSKVGPRKKNRRNKKMIGLLWNIRGLGKIGKTPALISRIRDHHVSFVGIMETKNGEFSIGYLKSLSFNMPFEWCHLKAIGSAGGILVGTNSDMFNMVVVDILSYTLSVLLTCKKTGFVLKLIVVYGPAYDGFKQAFQDELVFVISKWQGPTLIVGDFNLVRFSSNKSNGLINHRWADSFNYE
jgi:hypothetical protein